MVNTISNKVAMYFVVITVLDKFNEVISAVPAFVKLVASFKSLTEDIGNMSQEADTGTSGKTKVKQTAASIMAETVSTLVGMLHAYACSKEDQDLMELTDVAETSIIHTRDAERVAYANSLVDLVEKNKSVLVDWGVSDADIAEARQSIADYKTSLDTRNSAKTTQAGERESVDTMVARADRMLYRQIDRAVKKQKREHPDFFAEYQAARVIRNVPATRKGKNLPKPATGGTQPPK
jgi:hypothetical protein